MTASNQDGGLAAALLRLAEHGEELRALRELVEGHHEDLGKLRQELASLAGPDGSGLPYQPVPAPRWWLLEGEERQQAIDRLANWVEAVYQPSYGHLAARLPRCWREHPLCLFMLDWLSELHASLYLQPRRTPSMLSGQAEWQSRLLPAAADAMALEATSCNQRGHRR